MAFYQYGCIKWRCPNKKCGFSVAEEYTCCPDCGQKIKFGKLPKNKLVHVLKVR